MNDIKQKYDLIIAGAGISGLGLALAAVEKGLKVCLIEKNKISRSTSNNSLRIIHGGFRYLQQFDLKRVYGSAKDQAYCLNKYPEQIQKLDCLLPLSGKGLKNPVLVQVACYLYSAVLCLVSSPVRKPFVENKLKADLQKVYQDSDFKHFLCWQDAIISDPISIAEQIKNEILEKGATLIENACIDSYEDKSDRVVLKVSRDNLALDLRADHLVCCLGAGVNQFGKIFDCKWTMAFNLILKQQIAEEIAFACDANQGRNFFFVPRNQKTVVGTDYYQIDAADKIEQPSEQKIQDFIMSINNSLTSVNLSISDVESLDWGIIPVRGFKSPNSPDFFGSSLFKKQGRVVHILSTKYTGFRSQAHKALALIA